MLLKKSKFLNRRLWLQSLRLVLCWLGCVPALAPGQGLEAIAIQGGYWHHGQLVTGQKFKSIAGPGGDIGLRVGLNRCLAINLTGSYGDLAVNQEDAIEQWDWAFWQRFYRNYVRDLIQRDPNYTAILTPKQKLLLKSVQASVRIRWPIRAWLAPFADFGAGISFYERNLRLQEHWQKYFPDSNYTYSYSYDNHAEFRQGKVYPILAGVGFELGLAKDLALEFGGQLYHLWLPDPDKNFPLKNVWQLKAGLLFRYSK